MNNDQMRVEFEVWFLYNYKHFIGIGDVNYSLECFEDSPKQYIQNIPHHDWRVWQASRAVLVVELPDAESICYFHDNGTFCRGDFTEDCHAAIESIGVNVK